MPNTYFTGCEHYNHYNIIKFCARPFKDTVDMNDKIIFNHNQRVKDDDIVYHLGDYVFYSANDNGNGELMKASEITKQLNGTHIFIEGNHDSGNRNTLKTKNCEIILNQNKLKIQLIHNPTYAKIEYDLILNSHVHNAWKIKELYYYGQVRLMINCGVDANKFTPIRLDEILSIYHRWRIERSKINKWETPQILYDLNNKTKE